MTVSDVQRMPTWTVVVGGMFEPQIDTSRWSTQAKRQSHPVRRWTIPREGSKPFNFSFEFAMACRQTHFHQKI
jgi:hypothetical protein